MVQIERSTHIIYENFMRSKWSDGELEEAPTLLQFSLIILNIPSISEKVVKSQNGDEKIIW